MNWNSNLKTVDENKTNVNIQHIIISLVRHLYCLVNIYLFKVNNRDNDVVSVMFQHISAETKLFNVSKCNAQTYSKTKAKIQS